MALFRRSNATIAPTSRTRPAESTEPEDAEQAAGTAQDAAQADAKPGRLERFIARQRDKGIDGSGLYASAEKVAEKALRRAGVKKGRTATAEQQARAIRRLVRQHRRTVTLGGFITGLGGLFTLPVMLPANLIEYTIQSSRLSAAIAHVRGHDVDDPTVRAQILATLLGDDAGDVLDGVGLGPVTGLAGRTIVRRLPSGTRASVTTAVTARLLKRFGLRSASVFGKSVPALGGVLGALMDRGQVKTVARAAQETFPA